MLRRKKPCVTEKQTCKVLKRQGEGGVSGIMGRNMTAIGNGAVSSKIISRFASIINFRYYMCLGFLVQIAPLLWHSPFVQFTLSKQFRNKKQKEAMLNTYKHLQIKGKQQPSPAVA